jgi:integrase
MADEEKYKKFIKPFKKVAPPEPKEKIKKKIKIIPVFDKQNVISFINEHYNNESTRTTYLNHFTNKSREKKNHFGDFKSTHLDVEAFAKMQYGRHILGVISVYIKTKRLNEKFKFYNELQKQIASIIVSLNEHKMTQAHKKTEDTMDFRLEELKEVFNVCYDDIINGKENPYKMTDINLHTLAILTGMYGVNGCRDDIGNVLLNPPETNSKTNFIEGNIFHLRSYKTSKRYGEITFTIPPKLMQVINKSVEMFPREYLVENGNATRRFDKTVTRLFKKALNKRVTINMIRRAWVSEVFKNTPEKQSEIAGQMGHSTAIALLIYKRTI